MTVDTIPTDVSAAGAGEGAAPERQLSAREQMMARIEEKIDESRVGQEVAVPNREVPEYQEPPDGTTDEDFLLVDDPQRFKVRVKIGDTEEERTVDTVIRELQTANGRLRQTAQRAKELEAREREVAERERQIQLQTAAPSVDDVPDDELENALTALADGDTATAARVLKDLIGKGRQPATPVIDKAEIVAEVKQDLEGERVWTDFVAKNPEFAEQVDATGNVIVSEMRQYGDFLFERDYAPRVQSGELSYREALDLTAEAARKAFSPPPATKELDPPDPLAERRKRQEKIDNLPAAAGARNVGPAEEPEESPSDVIKQMRKARHLPV